MLRRWRVRHSYPQPVVDLVLRLAPIHGAAALSRWLDIPSSVIYRWRAKNANEAAPSVNDSDIETLATLVARCAELGFRLPDAIGDTERAQAARAAPPPSAVPSPASTASPDAVATQAVADSMPAPRRYVFDASKERPARAVRRRMEAVRHAVDTGYFLDVDCRTLAVTAGMSLHHFIRMFRDMFGISPHRYLMRARVEAAKRLLLASSEPIDVIAVGVGFRSAPSLNRAFKRIEGASASRYCQRRRKDGTTQGVPAPLHSAAGHGA